MATTPPNDPPTEGNPDKVSRILTPEDSNQGNTGLKERDLHYGAHVDTEEGDSSVRAGSWNKGLKNKRPEAEFPEGSSSSDAVKDRFGRGAHGHENEHSLDQAFEPTYQHEAYRGSRNPNPDDPLTLSDSNQNPPLTDQGIQQLVTERLSDDPSIDAGGIHVIVQHGHITLEGTVDSATTQEAVKEIAEQFGADGVEDHLEVRERPGAEPARTSEQ